MTNGIGTSRHFLQGGTAVPDDELNGIGRVTSSIGGCTGSLITDRLVLTAAHCMCQGQGPTGCVTRATFTFVNVFAIDDPTTRLNVSVQGDVLIHPDYEAGGVWNLNDYALIRLDTPASEIVDVAPLPVERPDNKPAVGDTLTLVGFGRTGSTCMSPSAGKQSVDVQIDEISDATIVMNDSGAWACPGDSGGPSLNSAVRIVGVASTGNLAGASNYDPTYVAYPWIFGIGRRLRTSGRVVFLRVHELGTGYGPPWDPLEGEAVVRLDTSDLAFGFDLRDDAGLPSHVGELDMLRSSFSTGSTVHLEYDVTGPASGLVVRVMRSR